MTSSGYTYLQGQRYVACREVSDVAMDVVDFEGGFCLQTVQARAMSSS